jgi:hypothetical protein
MILFFEKKARKKIGAPIFRSERREVFLFLFVRTLIHKEICWRTHFRTNHECFVNYMILEGVD